MISQYLGLSPAVIRALCDRLAALTAERDQLKASLGKAEDEAEEGWGMHDQAVAEIYRLRELLASHGVDPDPMPTPEPAVEDDDSPF